MATPFGTEPYHGLRYDESIVTTRHTLTNPTNYINAPLPPDVLIDEAKTAAATAALYAQRNKTYINIAPTWASNIYVVPENTPLVPVTVTKTDDGTHQQLAAVFADGIPIPEGVEVGTDSDAELVIYAPNGIVDPVTGARRFVDTLWELWRAKRDPTTGTWTCTDGGRMSYVSTSPGHWRNRTNGAAYPNVPTDQAKRDTFERDIWGVTAAKLPLLELSLTGEDIRSGSIDHALGFAMDPRYILKGKVWPANGYDGYATTGIPEGTRVRLPAGYVIPTTLHPVAQMLAACMRDYGWVLYDRAGALIVRATSDVRPLIGGALDQVLAGFPWRDVQALVPGTDSVPNPRPAVTT